MKLEDEISQKKFRNAHHKAAVNIIYTYNWLITYHHGILKKHGITLQQFNILRILRGQHPDPASVKVIRERMLDKMSDASRLVDKLKVKGLVSRSLSSVDRRQVDITLTGKGFQILETIDQENDKLDRFMSGLNDDEAQKLNELLDKLRQ